MDIRLDGFTLSLRLYTSLRFPHPPDGNDEEIARHDQARKILDVKDEIERKAALMVCEVLGYDEEKIEAVQERIRKEETEFLENEAKHRAEKQAARKAAGL